jgi:hypothetical protein
VCVPSNTDETVWRSFSWACSLLVHPAYKLAHKCQAWRLANTLLRAQLMGTLECQKRLAFPRDDELRCKRMIRKNKYCRKYKVEYTKDALSGMKQTKFIHFRRV